MCSKVGGKLTAFQLLSFWCFPHTENMKYLILLHLGRGYLNSSNTHDEVTTRTVTSAVVHHEANS